MNLTDIKMMDDLVEELRSIKEVVVMGNSPHINHLNFDKVDNMLSIGVNRIGLKYDPDILLWSDTFMFTAIDYIFIDHKTRMEYENILKKTKSKIKLCRKHENALQVPGAIEYLSVKRFGHTWNGGLKDACPSVCTAIHLCMVAEIDDIYIAGVDMASNKYFWGGEQIGSRNGQWKDYDKEGQYLFFKEIQSANYFCRMFMCSPESNIPGYEKTDYLNAV